MSARWLLPCLLSIRIVAGPLSGFAQSPSPEETVLTEALRPRALETLQTVLAEESEWVKVHAAEYLIALSYIDGPREEFEKERELHGDLPRYRIGIWRVLARSSPSRESREPWMARIRAALADPEGPDRLHAMETLAKLGYAATSTEIALIERDAQGDNAALAAYACGVLIRSGRDAYEERLLSWLRSGDERARSAAAYTLRHLDRVSEEAILELSDQAEREPLDSSARVYQFSAAFLHSGDAETRARLKETLLTYARSGTTAEKSEAIAALAEKGDDGDLQILMERLDDPEADVRASAAHAILRIGRRGEQPLSALDWTVIGLYLALTLIIGWYYSRRTSTTEDYLLGGRKMNPLAVGLSMFATLLSTLSYLAVPGEMIKHGPMIISQYLAFPFIFLVIGYVLIPVIMRQRVTSAYELLELRLGVGVRILGSVFFLTLRLFWMALIIYATSSKILVPLLGLDGAMTPAVCAVLGLVTIAYTSMGGLRAVVFTDVMQTLILFGGAFLTLVLITIKLGGISAWFPTAWSPDWDPVKIMYDPSARLTVAGAMTSAFVWYICTAGSDQVAIQRYLATSDASAARKVMMVSLATDILVGVFLAMLGVALWSYFQANPQMLPDDDRNFRNADILFPRFISLVLPAGISGLVIAGLLAAAMSSLSSGVNSTSLVISVDFIDRFGKPRNDESERMHLKRTKRITLLVGLFAIVLSIAAGAVGGSLLEVIFKVVNLLVAPLFVLFCMALFVPWATAAGAIAAGFCSVAMAVAVAYGGWMGLSFIWIMPMSLLAGMVVGPLVSLFPLFRPRKT